MKNAHFGNAIALLRAEHNFTQHELAARMGTHPSVVSKIERGLFDPRMETFEQIGKAFGMQGWEVMRFAYRLKETVDSRHDDEPHLTPVLWRAA